MSPRPYCSHCEGGVWIVDPDTGQSTKCPHCAPTTRPAEFHADVAADAHPRAADAALAIIRDATKGRDTLSANTVRALMDYAQIPGQVRGPAFNRAVALGLIEPIDRVPSTDAGTHGKPVAEYRVLRRSA